jgi:hypothetical protein
MGRFRSRDVGVVHLFCGLNTTSTPGFANLKAVLLRQLVLQLPTVSQELINTQEKATRHGSVPLSSASIDKALEVACHSFNKVFIVVDGLCEFGDPSGANLTEFLQCIEELKASSGERAHIFITSFDALQLRTGSLPLIQAQVTDEDLRIVMKDRLHFLSGDVQDKVVAVVSKAANGVLVTHSYIWVISDNLLIYI